MTSTKHKQEKAMISSIGTLDLECRRMVVEVHFQRRLVSRPTLPKMGNFDLKRVQTYSTILSLVSGS